VHSHIVNPPGNEETPYCPADIYQVTKMEGEKLALEYFRSGKLHGSVIRPAMIYGPGDMRTLKLFATISKNRFFYVGSGDVHVHFIDVRDLVRAFARTLESDNANGEVFIIAGKESVPLRTLVSKISNLMGVANPRIHLPVAPMQILGDICEAVCMPFKINPPLYRRRVDFYTKNRHFDGSKADRLLGFKPSLSLDQELKEIVDWYATHGYLKPSANMHMLAIDQSRIPKEFLPKHPFSSNNSVSQVQFKNMIEHGELSANHTTSVLMRYYDGTINFWNTGSQNVYGWDRYEAEGRISHHMLQTEFPQKLETINDQLMEDRIWKGDLIHTNRKGQRIEVASHWQVVDIPMSPNKHLIIETNIPKAA